MTENDSYDSPADVNILDGEPAFIASRWNKIRFASENGQDYEIDFKPRDINPGDLPFPVLGDGRSYGLKIKNDANLGYYERYISKDERDVKQSEEPDVLMTRQNPPRLIIKVE